MQNYILKRLLLVIPTMILVSIIIFGLIRFIPGDIVDRLVEYRGASFGMDAQAIREKMGLTKPIHVQYLSWAWNVLQGKLGESMWSRRSVVQELAHRYPITVEVALLTIVIATLWGVGVGVLSAVRQNTFTDYLFRTIAIIGLSVPYFWTSVLVLVFASIYFDWSPDPVYHPFTENPWANLKQVIVPAVLFAFYLGAPVARMTRATMLEVLRQDYMRTARAKGLAERSIVYRHALKNAFIPVITIVGTLAVWTLSGEIIVEAIWGLPGIGKYMVEVVMDRDYTMLQGLTFVLAFLVAAINLIVDISYAWLDPRIRYQ